MRQINFLRKRGDIRALAKIQYIGTTATLESLVVFAIIGGSFFRHQLASQ